jgi:quercetin dioxygenase-like cupin family protein
MTNDQEDAAGRQPHADLAPGSDASAYFTTAGAGSWHRIFPGVEIRTTAGKGLMLSVVTLEAGSEVLEHDHPHEQMGYLVSGRLEFMIGGITQVLNPGDVWRIPSGVRHRVRPIDGPAVAVDVFHPLREDYL